MYAVTKILIRENHPLFSYCQIQCHLVNNLYNAALFTCRQLRCGLPKKPEERHPLERAEIERVEQTLPLMSEKHTMPASDRPFVSYCWMQDYLRKSRNPDFTAKALPAHAAQNVVKEVFEALKSYSAALADWKANPGKYRAKPCLPGYKKSGGESVFTSSNQECRIIGSFLRLPKTKQKVQLPPDLKGTLKEVSIVPSHGQYVLALIMDDEKEPPVCPGPKRIAAIDPGVENFAAISNNVGLPCLLFKGGVLKSINHLADKKLAKEFQRQYRGLSEEERKDKKLESTKVVQGIWRKRNRRMEDALHKYASMIVKWCVASQIDTLVVGSNKGQKQEAGMGRRNNQIFCEIPYYRFKQFLAYRCEREGIRYVEQEESYTSKASFLDGDSIPVYRKDDSQHHVFSGKRTTRGQYRSAEGRCINADLNGSANIGRKAFPELYGANIRFDEIQVIRSPYQQK